MTECDKQTGHSPQPEKTVIIVTENRCGSNYLCALMNATGMLGNPSEYFSPHITFDNAVTIHERCLVALSRGMTSNRVVAIKVFARHLERLVRETEISIAFPNICWIWLRRNDLLAQAISRVIALQTRAWTSKSISQISPAYSSNAILRSLKYISEVEARVRVFFARNGISPFILWYEDLIARPEDTIVRIGSFVGVDIDPLEITTDVYTRVQRTSINEDWRERFISEMASVNYLDQIWVQKFYSRSFRNFWRLLTGRLPEHK
ncbi:MAG: sulfotransferase [Gammaproteobacteria bacterium]|nr:sulfotransferase [Gammaproteobacteria bacterium]